MLGLTESVKKYYSFIKKEFGNEHLKGCLYLAYILDAYKPMLNWYEILNVVADEMCTTPAACERAVRGYLVHSQMKINKLLNTKTTRMSIIVPKLKDLIEE